MSQKKNYSRYFIILQEDEKGYALAGDKLPSGYVKMELKNGKCKISYYAQNLKKEPTPYYMILICNKKDTSKIIRLGELNIDNHGRADLLFEYPMDNISGTGIAMDKVSGAAIVKFLDTNIIPVMTGFITTDVPNWRDFELVNIKSRNEVPEVEVEAEADTTSIFDKYEEVIETLKEPIEESSEVEPTREKLEKSSEVEEKTREKLEESSQVEEPTRENPEETIEEVEEEKESTVEQTRQTIETIEIETGEDDFIEEYALEDLPRGRVGGLFRGVCEGFEEIKDFCKDIKRSKWYKIPVSKIEDMLNVNNYNKHVMLYFPMINYYPYIKRHNHYVVGVKCDKKGNVKYLIYGIPGTRSREEQPFAGKSGFVTWVPKKEEDKDGMGYWLMFYDFRNSTILIPIKKHKN